jgi:microsomal epoxide hydrolase
MFARLATVVLVVVCLAARYASAADRWLTTSDGVRLHYTETGQGRTIVLVPGWTMPAWIFDRQIEEFSRHWRVIAFDPRAQGESEPAPDGYDPARRGADIGELIDAVGTQPVVLVGWSLGVLDSLAYVHTRGDAQIAGLVLIDNSVGEEPVPAPAPARRRARGPSVVSRAARMDLFVRGMFVHPQPAIWLNRLTRSCLRTPPQAAAELLNYEEPRSYWKEAVYSVERPVLYVVRPRFAGQAANLRAHDPFAETVVMRNVGHALFVDDSVTFNRLVEDFIRRRIWP